MSSDGAKKHSKRKKEKKSSKSNKEKHKHKKSRSKEKSTPSVEEIVEIEKFREAVQGKRRVVSAGTPSQLNSMELASTLGLSTGLVRTSDSSRSITELYSKELFGGEEDNPARRQRMKREFIAQRAIERAREVLDSRQIADDGSAFSGLEFKSRFCNSNSKTTNMYCTDFLLLFPNYAV